MTAQQLISFKETDEGLEITILNDKPCTECDQLGTDHSIFCEWYGVADPKQPEVCEERQTIMELVEESIRNNWYPDILLSEVLEYELCNSGWELVPEHDYPALGALTSAPLLSQEIERDENTGEVVRAGKVYWYARYETSDPIDQLLKQGKVVFDKGWREE